MRPLLPYFLTVGTSYRDTINLKRETVYSITMLIHEIGGFGVSAVVESNQSYGCEVYNFDISFCPEYEWNTVFSVATEFYNERGRAAQKNFHVTTYCSQAMAVWELCGCYKQLYLANMDLQKSKLFELPYSKLILPLWCRDFTTYLHSPQNLMPQFAT